MSEPRIISPLLDGFALGESMSYHSGVNCYPAMRADSDERYIVKTISIPASQTQLEALLLTGAYPNAEAARGYFKELVNGIRGEVEILDKLAAQRGFLPYEGYQVVPMEGGVGFEIYLISHYSRSLRHFLKRSPMTHLSAVNMGIDLCAALALCRDAGYLYVDLKPSNIYLTGEQEYKIGDLGFVSLDSVQFASLPDRCRSNWTAPEVTDAYASLNTTMDTYALGLVLYQVYNNGTLPFDSEESRQALMAQMAAGEAMPAPMYADYEMAQIIAKACAYRPEDRWQDPTEMGRALIAYMQRNGANDVPIGPPLVTEPELTRQIPSEELLSDEVAPDPSMEDPTIVLPTVEIPEEEPAEEIPVEEEALADEPAEGETVEASESVEDEADAESEPAEEDWLDRMAAILAEGSEEPEEADVSEALREILTNEDNMADDAEIEALDDDVLSEETAGILSQADELIAHEAPEPAVAPEPIDIPMPEPIVLEDEEPDQAEEGSEEPQAEETPADDLTEDLLAALDEAVEQEDEPEEDPGAYDESQPKKQKGIAKKIIAWTIVLILLAALSVGVYYGYTEYYLQEIGSVTADGEGTTMTVSVVTEMDQSLLTVVCVDQYGAKQTAPLTNGQAAFTGLTPDTQYNITLEVAGFHQLVGNTTAQYYTLPQTTVNGFTAVTGPEDGSVILNFTTEGPDVENWTVEYAAPGETPVPVSFTGNMITISGLIPGTAYNFTLSAGDDVYLIGQTELSFTASNVIYAENLAVTGYQDGSITAAWNAPEGVSVESWTVRCYNDSGFDETSSVTECTASFQIDAASAYTVEVTAAGMTQSARTYITANPITVTALTPQIVGSDTLAVTWEYEGSAPAGGWLLLYTVDQGSEQHVIQCTEASAVISPIAAGSNYELTLQTADSSTVFGGTGSVEVPEAAAFDQLGLKASEVTTALCKAPDKENWTYKDVKDEDKTSTFAAADTVGVLLSTPEKYSQDAKSVSIVYAFRDGDGKLACVSSATATWSDMWYKGHCDLEIPQIPAVAGTYTLEIVIGGQLMSTQNVTIQ